MSEQPMNGKQSPVQAENKPTDSQLAEWKAQYGTIQQMETNDLDLGEIVIVIKKPRKSSFNRFQDEVLKKGSKAMEQFVLENVLYPERKELIRLFEAKPGIVLGLVDELQSEMGIDMGFSVTEF